MSTKTELMKATTFEHGEWTNADGTAMRFRRNGKTKTWKRNDNFRIPVKHGLYDYMYIDQDNMLDFVACDQSNYE